MIKHLDEDNKVYSQEFIFMMYMLKSRGIDEIAITNFGGVDFLKVNDEHFSINNQTCY